MLDRGTVLDRYSVLDRYLITRKKLEGLLAGKAKDALQASYDQVSLRDLLPGWELVR